MFTRKRKPRKRSLSKKRKIINISLFCTVVLVVSGSCIFFFSARSRPKYISPVATLCATTKLCLSQQEKNEEKIAVLEKMLRDKQITFSKVTLSSSGYTITLPDNSQVLLSTSKDLTLQVSSLQFIISRLTMEGRAFKRLDLRFDKPVILF